MNIQTVANNLRVTIAGKEELLAQWEVASTWKDSDKKFVNETIQYLKINIGELKRILQDVEQCQDRYQEGYEDGHDAGYEQAILKERG